MKNPSPWHIALFASLAAAAVPTIVLGLHDYNTKWIVIIGLLTLVSSFSIFYYAIKVFIHRKIKIIYKNIFRFKSSRPEVNNALFSPGNDPIEDMEKVVLEWMRDNRKEIDQLKEQETFRREFIGNVSHELKTPVQSVQGYIHTLLDGALEDEKVNRKFLEKASNGADRLARLVNELTSISELQSGEVSLEIEKFDIIELFGVAVDLLEERIEEKNITVKIDKGSNGKLIVVGDESKIEQVITNLLVNAIKYGKPDGNVLVGFETINKSVLIEVTDDGEGIDKEHLPRLFERFYRTDAGRSRHQGGSGLGLAIVKHIIEAHGQTINVRSKLGEGSTFGFTLEKG